MPIVVVATLLTAGGCQTATRFLADSGSEALPHSTTATTPAVARAEAAVPAPEVTPKNFAQVQMALGETLAKEGNFEGAQAAYEAALRNDNSLARANHRLALVREKTGTGRDAKPLFLRAMQLDPKNAEIVCDYGYWCYLRHDLDEAQKQFNRALALDPNLKRAHNNLGLVYARTNRPDDALKHFALAGLQPAEARTNLGLAYLTQQRRQEARLELERAVNENPTFEKARNVLASFNRAESQHGQIWPQGAAAPVVAQAYAPAAPAAPAAAAPVSAQLGPAYHLPAAAIVPAATSPYPSTNWSSPNAGPTFLSPPPRVNPATAP